MRARVASEAEEILNPELIMMKDQELEILKKNTLSILATLKTPGGAKLLRLMGEHRGNSLYYAEKRRKSGM